MRHQKISSVTVKKDRLRDRLNSYRLIHLKAFEKAIAGFRLAAAKILNERIVEIREARTTNLFVNLDVPESRVKDYDDALTMLDWWEGDDVELTQDQFRAYVLDEWDWSDHVMTINSRY